MENMVLYCGKQDIWAPNQLAGTTEINMSRMVYAERKWL